jgi:hypothetical protein
MSSSEQAISHPPITCWHFKQTIVTLCSDPYKEEIMGKKVAVLVRDRQGEALRMSVGVTLMDDTIDVYVLDKKVESNDDNDLNLETIKDMGMKIASNTKENSGMDYLPTEELAQKLLEYDHIVPY